MSDKPKVSLIIVSRNRPDDLRRVLASLRFQSYSNFEVIVVSNIDPNDERVKYIAFDQPNISAARNVGISNSAGSIVAFCDDDAIPEPEWLTRLVPAFDDPAVGIAGGFVRGRNGISFQWMGLETDQFGTDFDLSISEPITRGIVNGRMLKVQGTNCLFRKSALLDVGGFDQGFAFFLDETDLSWRLTQVGWLTTIVPNAEVQHGFAASNLRGANRAPTSLHQIGMSQKLFLQKHAQDKDISTVMDAFRIAQRARLSRLLIWGQIEPRDVTSLMQSLDAGFRSDCETIMGSFGKPSGFRRFPTGDSGKRLIYTSIWHIFKVMRYAAKLSADGLQVTVFCFSRTSKFHNRFFDARGFWVQRGGVFGKSDRKRSYFAIRSLTVRRRVQHERLALAPQRSYEDSEVIKLP